MKNSSLTIVCCFHVDHFEEVSRTLRSFSKLNSDIVKILLKPNEPIDSHYQSKLFTLIGRDFILVDEKDSGISQGFNMALAKIKTEFVMYINAGDLVISGDNLVESLASFSDAVNGVALNIVRFKAEKYRRIIRSYKIERIRRGEVWPMVAFVFRTNPLVELGFNELLKYSMDTEVFLRMGARGDRIINFNKDVVAIEDGGLSQEQLFSTMLESFSMRLSIAGWLSSAGYILGRCVRRLRGGAKVEILK